MESRQRVLVINPGSTSTKIAVYEGYTPLFMTKIEHSLTQIQSLSTVEEQYDFRKKVVLKTLDEEGINLSKLDAVVGRGGLVRPIPSGTYAINELLLEDLKDGYAGWHASNYGGIIAYEIANQLNIPSFIVDPVVVDEMEEVATVSGLKGIARKSIFHALNQKATARIAAKALGKKYEDLKLIVVHMGGGITVGVHKEGRVIDVNDGLYGEGPFSPERAGTLPTGAVIDLCFSEGMTKEKALKLMAGSGGLVSYLGTQDGHVIEQSIENGNEEALFYYESMAYQIAKEVGAASTVLSGEVDGIILTGGLAYSERLILSLTAKLEWISDILVYPGEDEMLALATGAIRIINGDETAKHYPSGKMLSELEISGGK
ncbi:butyrate kinase [Alkalihalobacterium chitinilyticum]|uniref:Probable butyrate kinase n=1 Tax=Alkalihalobacterium chitinilyticum TaxID=2980103 RepID=A0ABT5V9T6_9BACI|nr:butyrate kinase [Alkalihalobacterium chitinilyticum]MDE5412224.1 butyrate kinase [Alkalihalobacterium chitinilyticum]